MNSALCLSRALKMHPNPNIESLAMAHVTLDLGNNPEILSVSVIPQSLSDVNKKISASTI
jgi:hypothetical protein